MRTTKRLKPAKDMTEDELLNEFRLAQSTARRRGQHLPLTVTRPDPENPTMHRPTVERDLDIFRREMARNNKIFQTFGGQIPPSSLKKEPPEKPQRVAQNKATQNVGKSLNKPRRFLGPFKHFLETLETGLKLNNMAHQRNLDIARELGQQGYSREKLMSTFGESLTPEIERAFQEGLNEANKRNQ